MIDDTRLLNDVMASISDFDSDCIGSSPVSTAAQGSLKGKVVKQFTDASSSLAPGQMLALA